MQLRQNLDRNRRLAATVGPQTSEKRTRPCSILLHGPFSQSMSYLLYEKIKTELVITEIQDFNLSQ